MTSLTICRNVPARSWNSSSRGLDFRQTKAIRLNPWSELSGLASTFVPSRIPALSAIATTILFVTLIFTPWGAVIGTPLFLLALLGWGWPRGRDKREQQLVESEA